MAVTVMQTSAQDITVRGAPTCRAYLEAKRNGDVNQALNHLTWFLGYMSGLAVARHVDVLGKDSAESLFAGVDVYCERYPARNLSDAGDMYYGFRIEQMKANPR
jgi:hypothetical protein